MQKTTPTLYSQNHYHTYNIRQNAYHPFGMLIEERTYSATAYRFGFNGKENDDDVNGDGNSYEYGFRIYNPRLGKFLSVDPLFKSYPWLSPYQFAQNDPIRNIDLDGLEGGSAIENFIIDIGDAYTDLIAGLFGTNYQTRREREKKENTAPPPNKPAPPVNGDKTKPVPKKTTADQNDQKTQEPATTANNATTPTKNYSPEDAKKGLKVVYEKYGEDAAIAVERIYRLETAHFKSGQFKQTGTGGMEAHGPAPSYGWNSKFYQENPQYKPVGTTDMKEGKGMSDQGGNKQVTDKAKQFVIMPSVEAGMMYLADYIERYGGNYARWYSTDPDKQELYKKQVEAIKPKFVEAIKKEDPKP